MKLLEAEGKARTGRVVPVCMKLRGDEKALALVETNHLTTDYRELRRWQFIYVNRNDTVAEWCRDLGPASNFPRCSEIRIWSFWEDEVDELMDQAEDMRNEHREFREILEEQQATSTLVTDFLAFNEERWKQLHNQSVFGPGGHTQRNMFVRRKA